MGSNVIRLVFMERHRRFITGRRWMRIYKPDGTLGFVLVGNRRD